MSSEVIRLWLCWFHCFLYLLIVISESWFPLSALLYNVRKTNLPFSQAFLLFHMNKYFSCEKNEHSQITHKVTNHKITQTPWSSFLFYFSLNFFSFTFLRAKTQSRLPYSETLWEPCLQSKNCRAWQSPQLSVKVFPLEEWNILTVQKALAKRVFMCRGGWCISLFLPYENGFMEVLCCTVHRVGLDVPSYQLLLA